MLRDAGSYRRVYSDISGVLAVSASTDTTTLVTARGPLHTLFIQKISFWVSTSANQSISFEDSGSPAKQLGEVTATNGDSSQWTWDYGEAGIALTQGTNFRMVMSAPGIAGQLAWSGYQKQTGVGAPSSA